MNKYLFSIVMNVVAMLFLFVVLLNESNAQLPKNLDGPKPLTKEQVVDIANSLLKIEPILSEQCVAVDIANDKDVNAYATADNTTRCLKVVITTGLLNFIGQNKGLLAYFIGHEIGHLVHGDVFKLMPDATYEELRTMEKSADFYGDRLATNAGYGSCNGYKTWKKFKEYFGNIDGGDHPSTNERIAYLKLSCENKAKLIKQVRKIK